jgi:hypothetical protein
MLDSAEKHGSIHLDGSGLYGSGLAEAIKMTVAQRNTGSHRDKNDLIFIPFPLVSRTP